MTFSKTILLLRDDLWGQSDKPLAFMMPFRKLVSLENTPNPPLTTVQCKARGNDICLTDALG